MMSIGLVVAASRLPKLICVFLVPLSTRFTDPLPVTSGVMSTPFQPAAAIGPDEPVLALDAGGLLA